MSATIRTISSDSHQTELQNTKYFCIFTDLYIIYSVTFNIIKCGLKILSETLP